MTYMKRKVPFVQDPRKEGLTKERHACCCSSGMTRFRNKEKDSMRIHKFLSAVAVVMLFGMLLAACGGAAAAPGHTRPPPSAWPTAAPAAADAAARTSPPAEPSPQPTAADWP